MTMRQRQPLWELTRYTMRNSMGSWAAQYSMLHEPEGFTADGETSLGSEETDDAYTLVHRTYKDRVFRMLFDNKKRLLELYNALNDTGYTNEEELIINTLENAIYLKMKNDVSFIVDYDMCLYEHQSTYCPNMPLRGLLYFADLYKKVIGSTNIATSRRIRIPTPHYVVFYNGMERQEEEFVQYLSDSFEDHSGGCIELTVKTININYGYNHKLLEKSPSLRGYSCFVSMVRENLETMNLPDATEKAIETCITKNILKDFFMEQKSEVVAMSIYEYNEEEVLRVTYEDGKEHAMIQMVEAAMENLGMDLETACKGLNLTVEEYQLAKSRQVLP